MEIFSALLAICAGNSPVPGEFPAQRPVTLSFDVFFDQRLSKHCNVDIDDRTVIILDNTPEIPFWLHLYVTDRHVLICSCS